MTSKINRMLASSSFLMILLPVLVQASTGSTTVTCEVIENLGSSFNQNQSYEESKQSFFHLNQDSLPAKMDGELVSDISVTLYVSRGTINGASTLQLSSTIKDQISGAESHSTASIGSTASGTPASTLIGTYSRGNHDSVAINCLPDSVLAAYK